MAIAASRLAISRVSFSIQRYFLLISSDGRVNYHIADKIPLEKIVPCTLFYKYDLRKIKNIDIFVDGTLVVISV